MANFGRRNLGPRRGNSRDLSPQGPFSGDLSRSKKNPDRGSGFLRGFAAGRNRRATVSAAGAASAINGGRRLAATGRTHRSRRGRKAGNAEKPAAPKSRKCRKAGSAERQAADDRQTAPDGGPQQDDGPCRAAGYNRKLAATGRRAVPDSRSWADGWPRRMAGRGRATGSR